MARKTPPIPCTGAGTVATDLQGVVTMSEFPSHGNCGICGRRWAVDGFLRLVVHPYEPRRGTGGGLSTTAEQKADFERRVEATERWLAPIEGDPDYKPEE